MDCHYICFAKIQLVVTRDFSDPIMVPQVPPWGQHIKFLGKMAKQVLDGFGYKFDVDVHGP